MQEDFLQRWLVFGLIREILAIVTGPWISPAQSKLMMARLVSCRRQDSLKRSTHGLLTSMPASPTLATLTSTLRNACRLTFATIHGAGPDFDLWINISLTRPALTIVMSSQLPTGLVSILISRKHSLRRIFPDIRL